LQPRSSAPDALVVSIDLPEIRSASACQLDVTERQLALTSEKPVRYDLSVRLPYPVDDESGSAKFDKSKKRLVSTTLCDYAVLISPVQYHAGRLCYTNIS